MIILQKQLSEIEDQFRIKLCGGICVLLQERERCAAGHCEPIVKELLPEAEMLGYSGAVQMADFMEHRLSLRAGDGPSQYQKSARAVLGDTLLKPCDRLRIVEELLKKNHA